MWLHQNKSCHSNGHSVIVYSPSCSSKLLWLSLFRQMKDVLMSIFSYKEVSSHQHFFKTSSFLFSRREKSNRCGIGWVSKWWQFLFLGELSHLLPPRQPLSHLWFGIFIHNFFKSEITEIFSYNNICSQIISCFLFCFWFFGHLDILPLPTCFTAYLHINLLKWPVRHICVNGSVRDLLPITLEWQGTS